ncbi:MAG: hypothetical protein AAGF92_22780 [Myxococcota bacterium]
MGRRSPRKPDAWERAHPKVKATKRATPLPAIEEAQLRALGYID